MQGIVLKLDLKTDTGLIRAEDGKRYVFDLKNVEYGLPLEGCAVDFETDEEGKPAAVCVVKTSFRAETDRLFWLLCSWRGRVSRAGFMMFAAAFLVLLPLLCLPTLYAGMPDGWTAGIGIAAGYVALSVLVKRFHDSGCSAGWIFLTMFFDFLLLLSGTNTVAVPFMRGGAGQSFVLFLAGLTTLFCLYLCFARGSLGENKYGKQPEPCKTIRLK